MICRKIKINTGCSPSTYKQHSQTNDYIDNHSIGKHIAITNIQIEIFHINRDRQKGPHTDIQLPTNGD